MKEQIALQKILHTKYEEQRTRNPLYSRRAFSKKLGLSAGAISELFNGQRKVSLKLAERLAQRLTLDPQERAELFELFPKRSRRSKKEEPPELGTNYLQLTADQFRIIGDWYHLAILSLMRTKGFKSKSTWIARRLGISTATTTGAIERLKRLGLISEDETGKLLRTTSQIRTSDDVSNSSIRRAHSQYLDQARTALETLPVQERDFTALLLTMSPSQMTRAKELIRAFQDKLAEEFEAEPQTEVFQLCMQIFPVTKIKNEGDTI